MSNFNLRSGAGSASGAGGELDLGIRPVSGGRKRIVFATGSAAANQRIVFATGSAGSSKRIVFATGSASSAQRIVFATGSAGAKRERLAIAA